MIERPSARDRARLLADVARVSSHLLGEALARRPARHPWDVPATPEAVTPEWLSGVLGPPDPSLRVVRVEAGTGSSGTSVRRQLRLSYHDPAAASAAGMPASLFAKTTPSLVTRLANGTSGTSRREALFYRALRPVLDLEAPRGYHSAFDPRSYRSIHLLEDLVVTRAATFCTQATLITRPQVVEMLGLLATLHGRFLHRPLVDELPWAGSYVEWWDAAVRTADVGRYHRRGFDAAADVIPAALRRRRAEVWPAIVASIDLHEHLPPTLLHNDVHLGNWYVTGSGRMGLCDWQCLARGHWSRDVAYLLATALSVDDRRAWERALLGEYGEQLGKASGSRIDGEHVWLRYRQQLPGALLMWTPTHAPPRWLPAMQPREMSTEMIRRIATAIDDLDALDAIRSRSG